MQNTKNIYGKRSFSGIAIKLAKTENSRGRQQKKKNLTLEIMDTLIYIMQHLREHPSAHKIHRHQSLYVCTVSKLIASSQEQVSL